jgi:transcriptional regulator with XRE-family HTH domain
MTPANLVAWMERNSLSKSQTASELGMARSTLDRYLSGSATIPRYIELACDAVEAKMGRKPTR